MTLFIKGPAIQVGQKNLNDWGIKPDQVDNAIQTLKSSVLKICPGEGHLCDYSSDPNGRIGKITDAWYQDGWIHTKASVTDSLAERKIRESTWDDLGWSTFGSGVLDDDGWAQDFKAETMTLVRHPAWKNAGWKIAAAVEGRTKLRTFSDFHLIASHGDDNTTLEDELKAAQTKLADLEKELEAAKKTATVSASTITELNSKVTTLTASVTEKEQSLNVAVNDVTEAKTQVDELTASVEKLKTELEGKTTLIASLEKEKAGSVPMDQLNTIIAAAIEKHDTEKEAKTVLSAARERFVTARKELGMETKPEEFTTLSAADFDTMTEMLSVKLSAGGAGSGPQIKYPANPIDVDYSFATGAYDAKTGKWA